jgi:hypothetical protein
MIDKSEIQLPEFFSPSQLLGESQKLKTQLYSFLIYEKPESSPELKFLILDEISSTIIKHSYSKLYECGTKHYVDLRGIGIGEKNRNLVKTIIGIGSNYVVPNTRISSDIGDVSNFIICDPSSDRNSIFAYSQGFLLDVDKKIQVFSNASDTCGSNIIRMVDDIKFDILDIKFEKVDLGTPRPKLNISIDIIIQPVNPKILRVFEDDHVDGFSDWVLEKRNKKIDRIYGED